MLFRREGGEKEGRDEVGGGHLKYPGGVGSGEWRVDRTQTYFIQI